MEKKTTRLSCLLRLLLAVVIVMISIGGCIYVLLKIRYHQEQCYLIRMELWAYNVSTNGLRAMVVSANHDIIDGHTVRLACRSATDTNWFDIYLDYDVFRRWRNVRILEVENGLGVFKEEQLKVLELLDMNASEVKYLPSWYEKREISNLSKFYDILWPDELEGKPHLYMEKRKPIKVLSIKTK